MLRVNCPICGGNEIDKQSATIAKFLSVRCRFPDSTTSSNFCRPCQFIFFERGLTETEAQRLYAGYRQAEYNKQRLSVEPHYASYIPMFSDTFSEYWTGRTNELLGICRVHQLMDSRNVLDFGGDGMIPRRIVPAARIVVDDLSVESSQAAGLFGFDLITASQVFEHLSQPLAVMKDLRTRLRVGGKLLVDVPLEYTGSIRQAWEQQGLRGGSLVAMHEHINHFSLEAMKALLEAAGFVPMSVQITPLNFIVAVAAFEG